MPNSRCAFSWPLLAAIGYAAALDTVAAQSTQMSNDAIRETVSGATVHLDAPLGTTIPLEFNENGTVTGTAGRLSFYLGAAADTGRWWTANNRLCYRWTTWFNGEPSCMKIARQGPAFAWESDHGRTGTAKIVQRRAVAALPPPTPTAPVSTATAQAKLDTAKSEASRSSATATQQRFAIAGATALPPATVAAAQPPWTKSSSSKSPSNHPPSKTATPAPASTTPAMGPQLPPSAGLGGPATRSAATRPPAAVKAAGAQATASRDSKIQANPAARSPRTTASASTVAQPQPHSRSQQSEAVGSGATGWSEPVASRWRVVNVDEDDVLNVRTEPFAEAPIVGRIPPDARGVKPLGTCSGGWCPVSWSSHEGWVHSAYVARDTAH